MNKVLMLLGMAKKAGFLICGEEAVGACARAGSAKLIFLAADASENAARRAQGFSKSRNLKLVRLCYKKEQLSFAFGGKLFSISAITDEGLALRIAQELIKECPEENGELAAWLEKSKNRAV